MPSGERNSERIKTRLDYKILNDKGDKVEKVLASGNVSPIKTALTGRNIESSPITDLSLKLSNFQITEMSSEKTAMSQEYQLKADQGTNQVENSMDSAKNKEIIKLECKFSTLLEEIDDHIDENPINSCMVSIEDIDNSIEKIEKLRSEQRVINREILSKLGNEKYTCLLGTKYEVSMVQIKEYIIHAKERKQAIRKQEKDVSQIENINKIKKEAEIAAQKKQAAEFLINEIFRITSELCAEFSKEKNKEVTNEEIARRKEDLPSNLLKLNQLSTKFQQCLEIIPESYDKREETIEKMKNEYDQLIKEKELYEKFIQREISERELDKEKSFQISSLNIKLQKFKNYDSEMDIYTFQSEFEKLYVKTTPRKMLPDLLKYNHLAEPALSIVKSLDDIDEMWSRLKKAYGDPKVMLNKKLSEVRKIGPLWKLKDIERIKECLISTVNTMSDLINLAKRHKLEGKLYYGEGLDMIYGIMGDARLKKWLTSICEESLEGEDLWKRLILFLEKELKVQQEMALINRKYMIDDRKQGSYVASEQQNSMDNVNVTDDDEGDNETYDDNDEAHSHFSNPSNQGNANSKVCSFCNEEGHITTKGPWGKILVQYFSCEKFAQMNPYQRYQELRKKGLCYMCLYPGALQNEGRHGTGNCHNEFCCKHPSHDKYDRKKHVLVCHEHRDMEENKLILEEYKKRRILNNTQLPSFSKEIKLSFVSQQIYQAAASNAKLESNDDGIIEDNGIYMLQTVKINDQHFTIFFDSGCSDMVSRYDAIKRIGERAKLEVKGPTVLGGVGNVKTESKHGIYQVRIPLHNGKNAVFTGVCLDQITSTFPSYPLKGTLQDDITEAYVKIGGMANDLPGLPDFVGGNVDFMIGSKYLRYHPEPIFTLPSGLTIYKSPFVNIDGSRGVIGGPHPIITRIDKSQNNEKMCQFAYLTEQYKLYQNGYQINPDDHLLSLKQLHNFDIDVDSKDGNISFSENHVNMSCESCHFLTTSQQKHFETVENAASEILYRCINCRKCQKCRNGERIEYISMREEIEQDLINNSVTVDIKNGITMAKLPLLEDPITKLAPNKAKALAVYNSQVKKLAKNPKDKNDVLSSEAKLQSLGHVDYVKNLPESQQVMLRESPIQNYIPWSSVWKDNSISTPCRIVFNASLITDSQISLNDILAKGRNNMNKLVEIIIRWRMHKFAFHTDVQKMYNAVQLIEEDWCMQRYIWHNQLDPKCIPEEKIVKTLIYGVKSSGNQAERGLRLTAELSKEDYPDANDVVQKDIYVDDCISGENSQDSAFQRADELTLILRRGGFGLKGFTFSKRDPPEALSEDGKSISVGGMKWYSKNDDLQLNINQLDFSKRCRGKHKEPVHQIPENLTRRHCVSKVAEIFDLTGIITPITASMKLDLHTLVQRNLKWDDTIPNDLRPIWDSHFEMINELKNFKFKRAIVPNDASSINIETIDTSDASKSIACIAIYARFHRMTGEYSCQLIFGRSKLIPDGMTIPRAELLAANLNAHTGEVIRRSFGKFHKNSLKLTDSQVTLHWINNEDLPLKQWVRNRVVEILRFTKQVQWKYITTSNMPADIGTRRGATLLDISENSTWHKGFKWMTKDSSEFPTQTYEEIKQKCIEASNTTNELISKKGDIKESTCNAIGSQLESNEVSAHLSSLQNSIKSRYEFSGYLVDPNKFRFRKVIRIVALVQKFIQKCKLKHNERQIDLKLDGNNQYVKSNNIINENEFQTALNYYFQKATQEVKQFTPVQKYEKISLEKDGILYYNGRILPNQQINAITTMSDTMRDLSSTTFHVPLVDKHSPLAYSIINEIHWHHDVAKHCGVETVLRYTMNLAYIIDGRELVKRIRKSCERCRILLKRTFNVSMGPVSLHNLTIAPAFYISQTDLAGPFKAYSSHNTRTTIKIWFVIFCCSTTSTTSIKVMEDYSSTSFISAFIRFSCDAGYPKILLTDEGSQLVKGCENMLLNFHDTQHKLSQNVQVEYEICPVGGHNMHGKVERKIKSIRESLEKTIVNERLSILQWETIGSQIANSINDLPISLGSIISDLENLDLITPNRLRLGRNNDRSPVGPMNVTNDPSKFVRLNKQIYNTWFEAWLISHVPNLMEHPKWFDSDKDLHIGDIVLFLKNENGLSNDYQYGMITEVHNGIDGKIRSVNVKYRNHNENVDRITHRASRQLIVIHQIDEIDIMVELGEIATYCDMKLRIQHQ